MNVSIILLSIILNILFFFFSFLSHVSCCCISCLILKCQEHTNWGKGPLRLTLGVQVMALTGHLGLWLQQI